MRRDSFDKVLLLSIGLAAVFGAGLASGDTWHLKDDQSWENVTEPSEGKYMLAKVKQLISSGGTESAQEALVELKEKFPEIAGPDLDAFMAADVLYAEGQWVKAVRKYDEFLENWSESWLRESALERQYSIAVAFLGGQKRRVLKILKLSAYEEAIGIMNGIADRVGNEPIAKRALVTLARGQERMGEYLDAYYTWDYIHSRWPTDKMGEESLLGMARSRHSAYRGPRYDSLSLDGAKTYYGDLLKKFPSEWAQKYDIAGKIATIKEELANKKFTIGEYYERTGSEEAAETYYQLVINKWPDTTAAKKAKAKLEVEKSDQASADEKPRKLRRRIFDAGNIFLDNWFFFFNSKSDVARETSETTQD